MFNNDALDLSISLEILFHREDFAIPFPLAVSEINGVKMRYFQAGDVIVVHGVNIQRSRAHRRQQQKL